MTKEEAKSKLKKNGYVVADDNSVVTVLISPGASMKNTIRDIKDKFDAWGYNASFSVKQNKAADEMAAEVEEESVEEDIEEVVEEAVAEEVMPEEEVVIKEKPKKEKKAPKVEEPKDDSTDDDEPEYYDEEDDADMLLTESSIQFSLEDFGLDF